MHASIEISLLDERVAAAVHEALLPEAAEGPEGSTTSLSRDGARLHAEVEAVDLSSLRAAINSVVRLLDAAARST